jgi:hypothetical protein
MTRSNIRLYSIIALAFCTLPCACNKRIDRNDYFAKINSHDSGLHNKVVSGTFYFDVLYTPPEYQVLLNSDEALTKEQVADLAAKNRALQYYQLEIGVLDNSADLVQTLSRNKDVSEQVLYYLSYRFQNDIFLEAQGQKYQCALFHFERSFDLRNSRKFLLAFENDPSEEVFLVVDSKLLSESSVKVPIDKSNIPAL